MSLQVYQGPSGVEALHQAASQIAALSDGADAA